MSGTVPVCLTLLPQACILLSWVFDADATPSAKRRKAHIAKQSYSLDAMPPIAEDVDNNGG